MLMHESKEVVERDFEAIHEVRFFRKGRFVFRTYSNSLRSFLFLRRWKGCWMLGGLGWIRCREVGI